VNDTALPQVAAQPIPELVFDRISEAILGNKVQPGDRLSESGVAEQMGVSQTSVREAFFRLEREGLLVKRPRRGTFVRTWSRQDLKEIASVRAVLEGLAARLATDNLTPEDSAWLAARITDMREALQQPDSIHMLELDLAFHSRIWAASGHHLLQRIMDVIRLRTKLFMMLTRGHEVVDYPTQHQLLLDALHSGNPEVAEQEARKHVMATAELTWLAMPDDEDKNASVLGPTKPSA
jgi:DNA-binding GntR family transcriptional regulator